MQKAIALDAIKKSVLVTMPLYPLKSYDGQYSPGVVKLCASRLSPVVYTGALDGVVRGWDLRSGNLVRQWHGHSSHILDLTLIRWVTTRPHGLFPSPLIFI